MSGRIRPIFSGLSAIISAWSYSIPVPQLGHFCLVQSARLFSQECPHILHVHLFSRALRGFSLRVFTSQQRESSPRARAYETRLPPWLAGEMNGPLTAPRTPSGLTQDLESKGAAVRCLGSEGLESNQLCLSA